MFNVFFNVAQFFLNIYKIIYIDIIFGKLISLKQSTFCIIPLISVEIYNVE